MNSAVILCGGLGTRLRPLLKDRPKALALVGGRPFLEYLLLQLKRYEINNVILAVRHCGEMIEAYFGSGDNLSLRLSYSYESEPLGTGGALKLAESLIHSEDFLVMNGDSFFNIDLKVLIRYHQKKKALVTIALAQVDNTQRYGTVEVDRKGRIVRFLEKMKGEQAGLINGGIYVFQRKVLELIPEGRPVSLEYEVFPKLIGKGFYGLPFQGYFVDIGVPEDYLRLQADPSRLLTAVNLKEKEG